MIASAHALASGLNDHQTGLSVDFTDRIDRTSLYSEFEDEYMRDTELYRWAVENCADYGFILRYPEGKEEFYGLACAHPAHFRYVGKEAARYIMDNGLCLEEFTWQLQDAIEDFIQRGGDISFVEDYIQKPDDGTD